MCLTRRSASRSGMQFRGSWSLGISKPAVGGCRGDGLRASQVTHVKQASGSVRRASDLTLLDAADRRGRAARPQEDVSES